MHATALARELGIPTVLVPARPGITNALGCVVADLRHDYVRTVNKPLSAVDDATVARIYAEQAAEGEATIGREGVPVRELRRVLSADMQFQGQSHILSVGVDSADIGVARPAQGLCRRLLPPLRHRAAGNPAGAGQPAHGGDRRAPGDLARRAGRDRSRADARRRRSSATRRVWFSDGWHETPVYAREKLPLDATFEGPAILEQLDCTTVVEPGDKVRQDRLGNLLISVS